MELKTETPPYKQLTHEMIQPTNGRAAAFTILGTLFFVLVANWIVMWLAENYPYNRGYWLVEQKWERLNELNSPVDWLVVGDSTGNQGLVPEVLTERLGGTAVNLNTVGSMGALDDVWMLEAYIERFGAPEQVLIIHSYDAWHRDVDPVFVAKTPLPWNSWQTQFTPPLPLTGQETLNLWLARYFPLYADNVSLGRIIEERVFLQRPILQKRYALQEDGFMLLDAVPESAQFDKDVEGHIRFVSNTEFVMSNVNRQALEQAILLAEAHNIEIYLAFGPLFEGLVQNEQFQRYLTQVRMELQAVAARSDNLYLLGETAVFPAEQMENADHVILEAAIIYTNFIADEIEAEWLNR